MAQRTKIFVSYSHRDREWLERLQVHLAPLVRSGAIDLWDDTRIESGERWRTEIAAALAETRVAILLVSADFLASDFIASDELLPLLVAAEREGVRILPVILSASLFEETPQLSCFQAVNPPAQPLIGMSRAEQEALLEKVARTVLQLVSPPRDEIATAGDARAASRDASAEPSTGGSPVVRGPRAETGGDLSDRVRAARELTATFAPERYTYLGLIALSALVLLVSFGKLLFGDPVSGSQQVTLVSAMFGAGGAVSFLSGRLLKLSSRTMDFIRAQSGTLGGTA